jgi:two-component system alkaline phosphatase synthesis response regulator PhoP
MPKRILLCDDEIHILRAAEFKLKRAGYDVQIASDGQEAWESIQQRVPDILITDCQMPRLSGFELTQRIRENPTTRHLPVLMLTAKGFELSQEDLAEKWNVIAVIAKPFSPRELLQTINRILGVTDCAPASAAAAEPLGASPGGLSADS